MFEQVKLGTKIAGGYAAVMVVTSLVTAYTLYEVNAQSTVADGLANEVAPQVQIGNEVERAAAATFKEMRSYDLSWRASYYELGMKQLDERHAILTMLGTHPRVGALMAGVVAVAFERMKVAPVQLEARELGGVDAELRLGIP